MRTLIIANPIIGINRAKREIVEKIIASIKKNNGSADISYIMKSGIGKVYSSRAALEGYDTVIAAGGDSTVNEVITGLVDRPTLMGIIPLGNGNGLACGLGIPFEADALIDMFSKNKTTSIDVGKISSKFFAAAAGMGYDVDIANDFNNRDRSSKKLFTYFLIALKKYFATSVENLMLIADGKEIKRKAFALTIANISRYCNDEIIAPQAKPQSGSLIAVITPKFSILKAIPMAFRLAAGSAIEAKDPEYIEFKTLKIKREKAGLFHVDGEIFNGKPTMNVTVLPHALTVIVP